MRVASSEEVEAFQCALGLLSPNLLPPLPISIHLVRTGIEGDLVDVYADPNTGP